MTLEHFVKKLQLMLKNPNAGTVNDGVLYLYTTQKEFCAVNLYAQKQRK